MKYILEYDVLKGVWSQGIFSDIKEFQNSLTIAMLMKGIIAASITYVPIWKSNNAAGSFCKIICNKGGVTTGFFLSISRLATCMDISCKLRPYSSDVKCYFFYNNQGFNYLKDKYFIDLNYTLCYNNLNLAFLSNSSTECLHWIISTNSLLLGYFLPYCDAPLYNQTVIDINRMWIHEKEGE